MEKEEVNSEAFRLALLMAHICYPEIVNEDTVNPDGMSAVQLSVTDEKLICLARYVKDECYKDYLKARVMIDEELNITNRRKE